MILNLNLKKNLLIKSMPYVIWKLVIITLCLKYNLAHNVYFLISMATSDIIIVMYIITKVVRENLISMHISTSGKEAYLSNKNMALLTENIHHEVKTPLVVIQTKIESLEVLYSSLKSNMGHKKRRNADKILLECIGGLDSRSIAEETFDMIKLHINSIHNVLDRMQNFKQIKHSNGNKTLFDIIQASFTTLKLYSKQSFTYIIDPTLKNYLITNLKNEDILNIFINHIKNSLEANASKIVVSFDGEINNGINKVVVYMSDNGNGIPESAVNNVFSPKFSTKSGDGEIRGVGLWLSKTILSMNGGDEKIEETSINGTTFCFEIPANLIVKPVKKV